MSGNILWVFPYFAYSLVNGHLGYFHLMTIVDMLFLIHHVCTGFCVHIFKSYGDSFAESLSNCTFSEFTMTKFCLNNYTIWHSQQQDMRVHFSTSSFILLLMVKCYLIVLICISVQTNDIEHLSLHRSIKSFQIVSMLSNFNIGLHACSQSFPVMKFLSLNDFQKFFIFLN